MKHIFYSVLFIVLGCNHSFLYAQPQLSYIIPDIGTPNFATYVEFIAPADSFKTFGTDGFYKHPSNIKIIPLKAADSSKIIIGPEIVSWDGRVVAAHIFVNPSLKPNSTNWDELDPEFIVPLMIVVGNEYSRHQNFYIVQPTDLSNAVSSPERIIGEGVLGKRSPRGAMIVSNAHFANEEYRVSTRDCDPNSPGNQGYLPFVFMATGTINAMGTIINVSADGKHGGPGGGGGGGRFCENGTLGTPCNGDVGGNGFTGGGGGGKNEIGANTFQIGGEGSGSITVSQYGSFSLNGVLGGIATNYESAGGGTGHPFGTSGQGCNDGINCDMYGGHGGGSGSTNNNAGGAGGNIDNGVGIANSGGRAHGNSVIIPLSGGSGGASGNPQSDSGRWVSSGNGGGGGGAISVYAKELNGLHINANGGDGELSTNGSGGGGSGGNVIIGARKSQTISNISLLGGGNAFHGSSGRIRLDAQLTANVTSKNFESAIMGLYTDSTNFSMSGTITLTGFATGIVEIYVYHKKSPGFALVRSFPNVGPFTQTITLAGNENLYYISTCVKQEQFSSSDFSAIPEGLITQTSWNIVDVKRVPKIQTVSHKKIIFVEPCDSLVKFDTLYIKNIGGRNLKISSINFDRSNVSNRFTIVSPKPDSIFPNDSFPVIIRILKPSNTTFDPMVDGDSIRIFSNSLDDPYNSHTMYYVAELSSIDISSSGLLDFGDINISQHSLSTITVSNIGVKPVTIVSIKNTDPEFVIAPYSPTKTLPMQLLPGQNANFEVTFTPNNVPMQYNDTVICSVLQDGCEVETTIPLRGKGIHSNKVTLTLPYLHQLDPNERNFSIPIFLSNYNLANIVSQSDTLHCFVSFDGSLFIPKSITKGILQSVKQNGDMIQLYFKIPHITLQNMQNEKITEIIGDLLLGQNKKSPLKFDSIYWNGVDIERMIDGELEVGICEDGGYRLLLNGTNFFAFIQPNPASTTVSVEIQPREIGVHSLSVFDIAGKEVQSPITFEPTLQPNGIPSVVKTIDVSSYPVGLYRIVIQTPTSMYSYPLQIHR